MRISDWSSDVCSSDLASGYQVGGAAVYTAGHAVRQMTRSAADPQTGETRTIDASASFTGAADAGDYTDFSYGVGGQSNQIGRESGRESVCQYVYISLVAGSLNKT